jgi:hypothetical protein
MPRPHEIGKFARGYQRHNAGIDTRHTQFVSKFIAEESYAIQAGDNDVSALTRVPEIIADLRQDRPDDAADAPREPEEVAAGGHHAPPVFAAQDGLEVCIDGREFEAVWLDQ